MAGIYLGTGTAGFYINNSSVNIYGQAGTDQINVLTGATAILTDQNIERVDLAGAVADFTFRQQGNQLLAFLGGTLAATIPIQGDADGSQIVFTDGSVQAQLSLGVMTLGGATVSATAGSVTPLTINAGVTSEADPSGTPTPGSKAAGVYLDSSDSGFHIMNNGVQIYGQSGTSDQIILHAGVTGIRTDQNIERVDLEGAVSDFTFQQQGNQLLAYSGGALTATIPLQGDADGSQIVFTDGSVQAQLTLGVMTLGGATVSATAGTVTPTTMDTSITWGQSSSVLEPPPSPPNFTTTAQDQSLDLIGTTDMEAGPMI